MLCRLVVFMQEQPQAIIMHHIVFRERKCPSDKASQSLPQNIIEAFDMAGLAVTFACCSVLLWWQYSGISGPKVRVKETRLILLWDTLPQQLARRFVATADDISHNLACSAALSEPDPAFILAAKDKRPEFVEFQYVIAECRG